MISLRRSAFVFSLLCVFLGGPAYANNDEALQKCPEAVVQISVDDVKKIDQIKEMVRSELVEGTPESVVYHFVRLWIATSVANHEASYRDVAPLYAYFLEQNRKHETSSPTDHFKWFARQWFYTLFGEATVAGGSYLRYLHAKRTSSKTLKHLDDIPGLINTLGLAQDARLERSIAKVLVPWLKNRGGQVYQEGFFSVIRTMMFRLALSFTPFNLPSQITDAGINRYDAWKVERIANAEGVVFSKALKGAWIYPSENYRVRGTELSPDYLHSASTEHLDARFQSVRQINYSGPDELTQALHTVTDADVVFLELPSGKKGEEVLRQVAQPSQLKKGALLVLVRSGFTREFRLASTSQMTPGWTEFSNKVLGEGGKAVAVLGALESGYTDPNSLLGTVRGALQWNLSFSASQTVWGYPFLRRESVARKNTDFLVFDKATGKVSDGRWIDVFPSPD